MWRSGACSLPWGSIWTMWSTRIVYKDLALSNLITQIVCSHPPYILRQLISLNEISHCSPILFLARKMCDIRVSTYEDCQRRPIKHQVRGEYLRCARALARPNQKPCVAASGKMRDLPLSQTPEDTDRTDESCPTCRGDSAPNSSD